MRDDLAERLLAEVMGWAPEDVAQERPALQAVADQKYDEYQQFSPGMRFVESLATWLRQFRSKEERVSAFEFIKKRLVFVSAAEMNHLVSIAFPDHIRPWLLEEAASEAKCDLYEVSKVARTREFLVAKRRCLFLGLSDGARIDIFRRCNNAELDHEQILQTSEVAEGRSSELLRRLADDVTGLYSPAAPPPGIARFRTVVLLDDFSASGISYLPGDGGGKVGKFLNEMKRANSPVHQLVDDRAQVWIVLYIATAKAKKHIEDTVRATPGLPECRVEVVHLLDEALCVRSGGTTPFDTVLARYYDAAIEDEHSSKGGTDLRHGFAGCGLPLVLHHNTPNNSLSLLWANKGSVRGLFPRVARHRKH